MYIYPPTAARCCPLELDAMEFQPALGALDFVQLAPKSLLRYTPPSLITAAMYWPLELDVMDDQNPFGALDWVHVVAFLTFDPEASVGDDDGDGVGDDGVGDDDGNENVE